MKISLDQLEHFTDMFFVSIRNDINDGSHEIKNVEEKHSVTSWMWCLKQFIGEHYED